MAIRNKLEGSGTAAESEAMPDTNEVGEGATESPFNELPAITSAPKGVSGVGAAGTTRLASGLPEASLASIVTRPGFFDVPPITSAVWMM